MTFSKTIYRKIRYPFNDILFGLGAEKFLLRNRAGKRLLVYHGVDEVGSLTYNTRFISQYHLEQQIAYFRENFRVVSLREYYEEHCSTDKLTIALTFDDGYANNFNRVLPILEKYQVPATFFITAIRAKNHTFLWPDFYDMLRKSAKELTFEGKKYIQNKHGNFISQESGELLNQYLRKLPFANIEVFIQEIALKTGLKMENFPTDYYLQMTVEQIKAVSDSPYVTIGSHSHTHADLVQRPLVESVAEMKFSKEWLEGITQKEVEAFAFPYGAYNLALVEAASQLGYQYILPLAFNQVSDAQYPVLKERFGNNPFLSVKNQIWCILNEKYL